MTTRDEAPLKALHSEGLLSQPKLAAFRGLSTEELIVSLRPGGPGALKVKPDVSAGLDPDEAFRRIEKTRGRPVPETSEQREWVSHMAVDAPAAQIHEDRYGYR